MKSRCAASEAHATIMRAGTIKKASVGPAKTNGARQCTEGDWLVVLECLGNALDVGVYRSQADAHAAAANLATASRTNATQRAHDEAVHVETRVSYAVLRNMVVDIHDFDGSKATGDHGEAMRPCTSPAPPFARLADDTDASPSIANASPPKAFVEFELARDVYATAFVLASNATEAMYSFNPWHNRQMRLLWAYLSFIVCSQAFVLACLVLLLPAVVDTRTFLIDCDARTPPAAAALAALEATAAANSDAEQCNATTSVFEDDNDAHGMALPVISPAAMSACHALDVELEVPLADGSKASYRRLEVPIYFYRNVFRAAIDGADSTRGALLALLQLVCCVWVTVQVYFVDCRSVEALLAFRDFNRWLLPLKVCDLTVSHHISPRLTVSLFRDLR